MRPKISNEEIMELVKTLREAGELRTLLGTSNGTEEPDDRDDMARMRYEAHYLIEAAGALEALAAERNDVIARLADEFMIALLKARFGPPSSWGATNPPRWHLDRPCTPTDAAMHDNGVIDAAKALRARQAEIMSPPPASQQE